MIFYDVFSFFYFAVVVDLFEKVKQCLRNFQDFSKDKVFSIKYFKYSRVYFYNFILRSFNLNKIKKEQFGINCD